MSSGQKELPERIAEADRIIQQQAAEIEDLRSSNQHLDQRVREAADELERRLAESNALRAKSPPPSARLWRYSPCWR